MSTNGTLLNKQLVGKHHSKQIKNGDEIALLTELKDGTGGTANAVANPDCVPRASHYPYLFQSLMEPSRPETRAPQRGMGLLTRGTSLCGTGSVAGYEELAELGRGSFATVKKVRHLATQHQYAMKVMDKRRLLRGAAGQMTKDLSEKVLSEARILKKVEHPGVVKFHEIFETETELFLVMELVEGGELFDHLCNHGPFTESHACDIMRQLLEVCTGP